MYHLGVPAERIIVFKDLGWGPPSRENYLICSFIRANLRVLNVDTDSLAAECRGKLLICELVA